MVTIYDALFVGTITIGTKAKYQKTKKKKKKINCADGLEGSCAHINNMNGLAFNGQM